jgi:transcriptional regulator with XRE-family HTH domain
MQLAMTAKGVMTMTIGEYVKVYRTEHSLSQRQFASLCGVSNGYISMLETGVNTSNGQPIVPTLQTMRKISNAMGRTIHQVLRTNQKTQETSSFPGFSFVFQCFPRYALLL